MARTDKHIRVSIIIPVHNEAVYLPACLESIAAQSVAPHQVIVVDNNSTDDTVAIAARYDFVTVIQETRQGTGYARNAGFDNASGDLLCRLDADTVLDRDWVAAVTRYTAQNPGQAACTGRCEFYDYPFRRLTTLFHETAYYRLQRLVAGTEILWGSNMYITHKAWQAVGSKASLSNDIPEDIDLSLVLQESGLRIGRSARLRATVSLRRGKTSPIDLACYLAWWPRVYARHHRYAAAGIIFAAYVTAVLVACISWLPSLLVSRIWNRRNPRHQTVN